MANNYDKIQYPFINFNKIKCKNPLSIEGYSSCSQTSIWGLNRRKNSKYIEKILRNKFKNSIMVCKIKNNFIIFFISI